MVRGESAGSTFPPHKLSEGVKSLCGGKVLFWMGVIGVLWHGRGERRGPVAHAPRHRPRGGSEGATGFLGRCHAACSAPGVGHSSSPISIATTRPPEL